MEGLAASVVLLAILLGVLLVVVFDVFCLLHLGKADTTHFSPKFVWAVLIVCISPIGGLVYLLAQRLPKRPMKPVNRGIGVASIILVLFVIVLWVGIKSASHPHPQPPVPLTCPTGPIWALLKGLCLQL
jgi:phospholipase D-like protein